MIEYNEVEKIMFLTQLALQCAKRNYMKDDLKISIIDIIKNNSLETHKSEIDPEDFEAIKSDLEKVKHYIKG